MPPYSILSSPQSNLATAGSTNTSSPQTSTNSVPLDTSREDYERNMASYTKYCRRSAYGGGGGLATAALMAGAGARGGSKPSAVPSPTAPIFTPSSSTINSNKAARAEAMRKIHIHNDRKMRQLRKLEEDFKKAMRNLVLVEKDEEEITLTERVRQDTKLVPTSPSATSVGSWTDDEYFIPSIKK